jgi:hypothetical protein
VPPRATYRFRISFSHHTCHRNTKSQIYHSNTDSRNLHHHSKANRPICQTPPETASKDAPIDLQKPAKIDLIQASTCLHAQHIDSESPPATTRAAAIPSLKSTIQTLIQETYITIQELIGRFFKRHRKRHQRTCK